MFEQMKRSIFICGVILWMSLLSFVRGQDCKPLDTWPVVSTNWSSCSVLSDGTETINSVYAECMFLKVPINWNATNFTICTQTLDIFVKRYFIVGHENTSHHLWRIPGGGGIPISTLEYEAISVVTALNGSISIYVTDKRGVGNSGYLECPTSIIKNFNGCLPYIRENKYRLEQNTYTNTAHDLEYVLNVVMGKNREHLNSNQRVAIMASSQGTYLTQRYLQVTEDNEQVDAVILDSILPTDITRLVHGDTYLNYIFLDLFTRCSQDQQGCAKYFEYHNPLRALYTYKINEDFIHNSSCLHLLNLTTIDLAKKMSFVLYPLSMQLLPALIYRINRCNSDDQNVLKHFSNVTQPPNEDGAPGYSILVELNNNLAELWSPLDSQEENPSCDYLKGIAKNTFASTHVMPDIYCPIQQKGILGYPTDPYYRKYPTKKTQLPVLLLHGDMDQALPIPIPRHFARQYSTINSNLTYIELPRTGHTATNSAPMIDQEGSCGWNLAMTFFLSATFKPDRSCLDKILPLDFAGTTNKSKQSALRFFGTENIWDTKPLIQRTTTITNIAVGIHYNFFVSFFPILILMLSLSEIDIA